MFLTSQWISHGWEPMKPSEIVKKFKEKGKMENIYNSLKLLIFNKILSNFSQASSLPIPHPFSANFLDSV